MGVKEKFPDYFIRGQRAEGLFILLAMKRGYSVHLPSKKKDIKEHWDVLLVKKGRIIKVDVKTVRDKSLNGRWIELVNVRGENGWLLGEADAIAFELEEGFLIVPRDRLYSWVNMKASGFTKKKHVFYEHYERGKSVVVYTPLEDIKKLGTIWTFS